MLFFSFISGGSIMAIVIDPDECIGCERSEERRVGKEC